MSEIDDIQRRAAEVLNQRVHERFKASLQVRYRSVGQDEKKNLLKNGSYSTPGAFLARAAETQELHYVVSEDLSKGGLRVSTPQPLPARSELWVNLKLPSVPVPVNALAEVVWTRTAGPSWASGLRFFSINDNDIESVEKFLALQSGQA